jgi:hypothetical protein
VRKHIPDVARPNTDAHADANPDADADADTNSDADAYTHADTNPDADAVTRGRGPGGQHHDQPEPSPVDKRCRRWL